MTRVDSPLTSGRSLWLPPVMEQVSVAADDGPGQMVTMGSLVLESWWRGEVGTRTTGVVSLTDGASISLERSLVAVGQALRDSPNSTSNGGRAARPAESEAGAVPYGSDRKSVTCGAVWTARPLDADTMTLGGQSIPIGMLDWLGCRQW